jgi:hypothetical protein
MAARKKTNRQTAATRFSDKESLTLYFDTQQGVLNFRAWYLDEGGEQSSNYYSEDHGKNWMYLKAPDNACPHCEYWNETFDDKMPRLCPNCEKLIVKERH